MVTGATSEASKVWISTFNRSPRRTKSGEEGTIPSGLTSIPLPFHTRLALSDGLVGKSQDLMLLACMHPCLRSERIERTYPVLSKQRDIPSTPPLRCTTHCTEYLSRTAAIKPETIILLVVCPHQLPSSHVVRYGVWAEAMR
jgi:hypothetical protein